jgi:hypothetical protein
VIPALAKKLGVIEFAIALLAAELEWDERGGWWLDSVEDGVDSVESTALLFTQRSGQTPEGWSAYVSGVLEERAREP